MECPEALRTQAYFDGELDASSVLELERHLERCGSCRGRLQDLEYVRTAIRALPVETAPGELRRRIGAALDDERGASDASHARGRKIGWTGGSFWQGALSGVAASALIAFAAAFIGSPSANDALLHDLSANQLRSLMPSHLIDVVSTDQHTVKPWFSGHADVSPVVADFAPDGYRLIGGRADYLDHQRAAVVVYQHGSHVINVFAWLATTDRLPPDTTRNGYHMTFWRSGDLAYCAISDTAWQELLGLRRLIQERDRGG